MSFPYKSVRYLELRYLELLLCQTICLVPSVIFGLFPIRYLEHSNEVFEWILLFISGIRMLITALIKLCLEVCSFFFQNRAGSNIPSVKRKLHVKSLGETPQGLRDQKKLHKQSCSLQTPSNLIFLTIFLTMRPLTKFQPKIRATKLQKSFRFYLTW